jgi:inner membrane protein
MDNICHTLVGAVCGEAGLKHRSRLANATLMIAANLPDIDVAVFATGTPSVAFRRGWTHGILAQAILPPALALVMWWLASRKPRPGQPPAHLGWLVALSYLGVLSHVGLDLLNNYGVRLLMPFSNRWFYGDTLFIVDPWLWAVMGAGVWLARRQGSPRPARRAVVAASVYVLAMFIGARVARGIVLDAWTTREGRPPVSLMVGPRPVLPLTRDVIVDAGDRYVTGTFTWLPVQADFAAAAVSKHDRESVVAEARDSPALRPFLVWSRFPVWTIMPEARGTLVSVEDLRFSAARRALGGRAFSAETIVEGSR